MNPLFIGESCRQEGRRKSSLLAVRTVFRNRLFIVCASVILCFVAVNAGIVFAVAEGTPHQASAWPDSSSSFWPERSWHQVESRIRALPASRRIVRKEIGAVKYGKASYTIHLLRFPAVQRRAPPLRVLLVSGMHGTEVAGVEALLQIAEALSRDPQLHPTASIDIIPVMNPWGWVHGYRYDGEGEDVNRDFSSRRTKEAALLRDFMGKNGPWDLVLDLHESKKYGYFIYQYLPPGPGLGDDFVKILRLLGKPRENSYREGIFQVKEGILSIPAPALAWISLAGRLSLEHYARLHGTPHAYTVETPLWDDLDQRVAVHRRTVDAFVRILEAAREAI
jgi:hypothetical protein